MSIFSDTLSSLIKEKNIKIFSMVKYCGLDRSTMYKIISGKRNPPSPDIFKQMKDYMRLTPSEEQQLTEAWKIARIGSENYYRRKSVENFICNFPVALPAPADSNFRNELADHEENLSIPLPSRQHVDYFIHRMILSEASRPDGTTGLFLQPDHDFLFRLLSSLKPAGRLHVRHILCLSGRMQFTDENELYDLACLKKIFPLYMIPQLEYRISFFYDEIHSHYYNYSLFPCMILTSDSAVLCSCDYSSGIYLQNKDMIRMLWKLYNTYYDNCSVLFEAFSIIPDNCDDIFRKMFASAASDAPLIGIQPEACLTPFLSGGLLDKIFNHSLPNGEEILKLARKYFRLNKAKTESDRFFIYFTYNGLVHFARTGLLEEIPEIFYHPLTADQRAFVLKELMNCCQNKSYRILKEPLNYLPRNLHLCICVNQANIIFKNNNGEVTLLTLKEPGLVDAFQDYMGNMEDSCFYTAEEAVSMIQELILNLDKELP